MGPYAGSMFSTSCRLDARAALAILLISTGFGVALGAETTDVAAAAALDGRYVGLQRQLEHNAFQRPLYLESSEAPGVVRGDIYAVVASPFDKAGPALAGAPDWCDILMLHLNTKDCRV